MKFKLILMLAATLLLQNVFAQVSKLNMLDPQHLELQKKNYQQGKPDVVNAVNIIIKTADSFLNDKPGSVMQKAFTPPSGSKHDYMSLAPYFWPNPATKDGLPYIRKDGQRNPEIRKITDHERQSELADRCKYLSLAWYFTGDQKYAAKASQLLSAWFIDPDTKMNPNLNYAQAIRGVNEGRGIGIIETLALVRLTDWISLLQGAQSFPNQNLDAIKSWYKQYINWMMTSKNGRDEHNAKNNHGTHYDTQLAGFALFTGNKTLARQVLNDSKKRIALQIEPDGRQPLELARTNAYGYSTFNLNGWCNMALLGERAGVDLWHYATPDGRSMHKAIDWLIPYAFEEKPRDRSQISPYHKSDMYLMLILAAKQYHDDSYAKRAATLPKNDETAINDLLYN